MRREKANGKPQRGNSRDAPMKLSSSPRQTTACERVRKKRRGIGRWPRIRRCVKHAGYTVAPLSTRVGAGITLRVDRASIILEAVAALYRYRKLKGHFQRLVGL